LARGVHCPVKIIPPLLDLHVRLIDAIGVVGFTENAATALVEFGRIALYPPKYHGVIDGCPSFSQQFFDIPITQRIAEIPPYATDDDLTSKVTPFEERGLVHEKSPVI